MSYLHTIKRLGDFWGIFHFEEGAQVSSSVEKLYLKSFVSKSNLTADKVIGIVKNLSKVADFCQWLANRKQLFYVTSMINSYQGDNKKNMSLFLFEMY